VQALDCADNRLEGVGTALACLPLLSRLSLAANRLAALPPLPWLPHLASLNLADNPLTALAPLLLQPRLRAVNLSLCALPCEGAACALHALPHLQCVQVDDLGAAEGDGGAPAARLPLPWLQELNHGDFMGRVPAGCAVLAACPQAVHELRLQAMGLSTGLVRCGVVGGTCTGMRGAWQRGALRPWHAGGGTGSSQARYARHMKLLSEQARSMAAAERAAVPRSSADSTSSAVDVDVHMQALSAALYKVQQTAQAAVHELVAWHAVTGQPLLRRNPAYGSRRAVQREHAATRLQAAWRAHRLRAERERQRRVSSSTQLPAAVRGWLVRRGGELQRRRAAVAAAQSAAAVVLQAAARGWRVRRRFATLREAANGSGTDSDDLADFDDDFLPQIDGLDDIEAAADHTAQALPSLLGVAHASVASASLAQVRSPSHRPRGTVSPLPLLLQKFRKQQEQLPQRQRQSSSPFASADSQAAVPAVAPGTSASGSCDMGASAWSQQRYAAPESDAASTTTQTPSELPPVARGSGAAAARRAHKVAALQAEWGFQDAGTAEASMRRQCRSKRGAARPCDAQQRNAELNDPSVRLLVCSQLPSNMQTSLCRGSLKYTVHLVRSGWLLGSDRKHALTCCTVACRR
jgi:IQ calmodulin-binding motif